MNEEHDKNQDEGLEIAGSVGFSIPPFGLGVSVKSAGKGGNDNIIRYGSTVAIRVYDGNYWQTNLTDQNRVMAITDHVQSWELFEIVAADDPLTADHRRKVKYGDKVAFRAHNNCKTVGVNLEVTTILAAWVGWVQAWETFTLLCPPDIKPPLHRQVRYGSPFALQAANGLYVSYEMLSDKTIVAARTWIRAWEVFHFVHPER